MYVVPFMLVFMLDIVATSPCSKSFEAVKTTERSLPFGVHSIVDYGADSSGQHDSTAALQRAMTAARTQNVSLFVPFGCYIITDVINATEPRNGRWQPIIIFGEKEESKDTQPLMHEEEPLRPIFFLPPNTPGYTNPQKARPMFSFWADWCLAPGADTVYDTDEWCTPGATVGMSPYMFNMVFQDIHLEISNGNPGAIGIDMLGAQGCTIQDVTIRAAPDALAGVFGGNGGGGSFVGITVIGGRYGIDNRKSEFGTIVTPKLINQTCAGLLVGSGLRGSMHASGATSYTGLVLQGNPQLGGVLAGINLPLFPDFCAAPIIPGGWRSPPYLHNNERAGGKPAKSALLDSISLIDGFISIDNESTACIVVNGSAYINNTYTTGCNKVIVAGGIVRVKSANRAHIAEAAIGRTDNENIGNGPYGSYRTTININGEASMTPILTVDTNDGPNTIPPASLSTRHHWGTMAPDWQSSGAVDAKQLGAKGDGVTDDWMALQRAVQTHDIVMLPKGYYRLSQPLVLSRPGSALIGIGLSRSILMPTSKGWEYSDQPVLNVTSNGATVKGISIVLWDHLAKPYAMHWSGANGVWRQSFFNRMHESTFPPFDTNVNPIRPPNNAPKNYSRPLFVLSGGGAFYEFNLDFGCCFGTATIPNVDAGPDIASSGQILLQQADYRSLLINGSSSGVRFYPHNMEQSYGDAHTEIYRSSNVTMYNSKSEGNPVSVWVRESDAVTIFGHGGNACPFPNSTIRPGGYAQLMPTLFRVMQSSRVTVANTMNSERVNDAQNPSTLLASGTGYSPAVWNMIITQNISAYCDPRINPSHCTATAVFERPVLWRID
eukprot:m.38547 g.38547  ORF g.38547 m.38547 type:complete len:833 (-) comp9448_c0_seq1:107-2605(-)